MDSTLVAEERAARLRAEAELRDETLARQAAEAEVARVRRDLLTLQMSIDTGERSLLDQSAMDEEAERLHAEVDALEQRMQALAAANRSMLRDRDEMFRRYAILEQRVHEQEVELRHRAETIDHTVALMARLSSESMDLQVLRNENSRYRAQLADEMLARRRAEDAYERAAHGLRISEETLRQRDAAALQATNFEKDSSLRRNRELEQREQELVSSRYDMSQRVEAAESSAKDVERSLQKITETIGQNGSRPLSRQVSSSSVSSTSSRPSSRFGTNLPSELQSSSPSYLNPTVSSTNKHTADAKNGQAGLKN